MITIPNCDGVDCIIATWEDVWVGTLTVDNVQTPFGWIGGTKLAIAKPLPKKSREWQGGHSNITRQVRVQKDKKYDLRPPHILPEHWPMPQANAEKAKRKKCIEELDIHKKGRAEALAQRTIPYRHPPKSFASFQEAQRPEAPRLGGRGRIHQASLVAPHSLVQARSRPRRDGSRVSARGWLFC